MSEQSHDPAWLQYQQQMNDENVRTLVILHRVYAGLIALGSCCVGGYFVFILGILGAATASKPQDAPPPVVGAMVTTICLGVMGFLVLKAILNLLAANWLRDRRNWTGIVIVAAIDCLNIPLGAALGIFSLIVINRPTVRSTFQ
ncbi:MAG: hypothetical protein ACHQ50_15745 [Fimbriimonadales bacterium]